MTRKTGALVLVALALSVAFLGVLLAVQCERTRNPDPSAQPRAETLTILD